MQAIERAQDIRNSALKAQASSSTSSGSSGSSSSAAVESGESSSSISASAAPITGAFRRTVVEGVRGSQLYRPELSTPSDAPLTFNTSAPFLGDRVVNLHATGVPFGLKGTVVTIHGSTGFVEVRLILIVSKLSKCDCYFCADDL